MNTIDTTTKTARLFVPNHTRPRTREEETIHLKSYLLKSPACPREIVEACAEEMASLIAGEDGILIPVPDSKGDTKQNLWLANRIAKNDRTGEAKVIDLLTRTSPTESQCQRHRKGKTPLTPEELKITVKPHKPFILRKVYFVDNCTTSGNTLQACHDALGFGTGLVYAEAIRRK